MSEQPHGAHDDHGHGHGHGSRFIQHHYDDAHHQFESGKLGIWLFLAQEVLFFSALFVAYVLYRFHHPEIYAYAHKYLDVKYGAINTGVLIFSSLTAAWAVRCAQLNQRKGLILCIAVTIACAFGFLGIKYIEYSHKIHEHILFGRYFDPCVASGGNPLLTKNNECHGSKSSVIWDSGANAPIEGCFAASFLDSNPKQAGVQAPACKVFEVKGDHKRVKSADGKSEIEQWVPSGAPKEITQMCPDPLAAHHAPPAGEHGAAAPAHAEGGHGQPCWRAAYQPAVCNAGYSFHWRCEGPACAAAGDAFGSHGPYSAADTCKAAAEKKLGDLKKLYPGAQVTVSAAGEGKCDTGNTLGFLVEYHDHEAHHGVRIEAECKDPPKPEDVADPLADKLTKVEAGTRTTGGGTHKLSAHEEHAAMYAGPPPENTNMFFTIYFAMTGLHGLHVLFGIFVFIWLLVRSIKGHFTPDYFGPVDFAALYWHIVDLIWIFLFPLLYLIH